MHPVSVDHPALRELFDTSLPNSPALWAVLNGRHSGRAVVDDIERPSQSVLRTDAALTYFTSLTSQPFLNEAIAGFRELGPVWLVWLLETQLSPPVPESVQIVRRIEFREIATDSPLLSEWRKRLPEGLEIRPISRELLERCLWRNEMAFYCGGLDNFMTNGLGICLMRDDDILVEAYASSLGERKAEIGAITHEPYRSRDYATIACAYLIAECAQRGFQAYWSCDVDNPASIRVAHKLGFRGERPYQIFAYESLVQRASSKPLDS